MKKLIFFILIIGLSASCAKDESNFGRQASEIQVEALKKQLIESHFAIFTQIKSDVIKSKGKLNVLAQDIDSNQPELFLHELEESQLVDVPKLKELIHKEIALLLELQREVGNDQMDFFLKNEFKNQLHIFLQDEIRLARLRGGSSETCYDTYEAAEIVNIVTFFGCMAVGLGTTAGVASPACVGAYVSGKAANTFMFFWCLYSEYGWTIW